MKIVEFLFPFKLHFRILQLEGYSYTRYLEWVFNNFFTRSLKSKKEFEFTKKVFLLIGLVVFFGLVAIFVLPFEYMVLFLLFPQILIGLALASIWPLEYIWKRQSVSRASRKLINLNNLTAIGITGSYGKTSTKEILYTLMKSDAQVLRTPGSYNTLLGISRVIMLELDSTYDYFIAEMAAFKQGEILGLTQAFPPKYGIITGISNQHLERFGSLKNIIAGKFELFDSINNLNNFVFNLDDMNVIAELKERGVKNAFGYGISNKKANVKARNIRFSDKGSSFILIYKGKRYQVKSPLFGYANVYNFLGAFSLALKIGISDRKLLKAVSNLKPVANRMSLSKLNRATLVDNTYSSNMKAFVETIRTAKEVRGERVLVTPGLVELGEANEEVHVALGKQAAQVFEKIVLVGKNERTSALDKGIGKKVAVKYISDTRIEYANELEKLSENFDWVFLENDVTENY